MSNIHRFGNSSGVMQERDLGRFTEARGMEESSRILEKPIFVIQKHQSTTLHYDLRIQVGEVLKSWAVPKGPSYAAFQKRLAIQTEDHPLEYASFEGIIPKGEYGAGVVLLWDQGYYDNLSKASVEDALNSGQLSVFFHGQKLKGGWALIKFGREKNAWLMVKQKDRYTGLHDDVTKELPNSVLTGRRIDQTRA